MLVVAAAAHLALPCVGSGAEAPAVVTLVEGQGVLLRPAGRFSLAEGVRVEAGDIVEVAEKGLVQIGFGDGTRLSLGPQSRVHVAALASRGAKAQAVSDFYLLRGWSKVATAAPAAPLRLSTPLFALATNQAVFVLQVQSKDASVFVEGGELRLPDGFVKAGQFYTRSAGQRGALQPRAPAAFVDAMPRPYQDNLPERLAKLKEREVPPRRLGELTYADVQAWLTGPSELRRPIVQRLRSRARDPEFRKALIANMPLHPEWDRIVFPDKYKPKSETP